MDVLSRFDVAPDGTRLALELQDDSGRDIWVYDSRRDSMTRLTFGGEFVNPRWSPDGQFVVFGDLNGVGLAWTRADGAG